MRCRTYETKDSENDNLQTEHRAEFERARSVYRRTIPGSSRFDQYRYFIMVFLSLCKVCPV